MKPKPAADLRASAVHRDAPPLPGGRYGDTGWYGLVSYRFRGTWSPWAYCEHAHRTEHAAQQCAEAIMTTKTLED